MLAPLRDHLSPKNPRSSPLLCATKGHYFFRVKVNIDPDKSNFEGTRWITSEDIKIEHLDVFTAIDANSAGVGDTCAYFSDTKQQYIPSSMITTTIPPRLTPSTFRPFRR